MGKKIDENHLEAIGSYKIIELLLDKGADLDSLNNYGVSPRSLTGTIANYDLKKYMNR